MQTYSIIDPLFLPNEVLNNIFSQSLTPTLLVAREVNRTCYQLATTVLLESRKHLPTSRKLISRWMSNNCLPLYPLFFLQKISNQVFLSLNDRVKLVFIASLQLDKKFTIETNSLVYLCNSTLQINSKKALKLCSYWTPYLDDEAIKRIVDYLQLAYLGLSTSSKSHFADLNKFLSLLTPQQRKNSFLPLYDESSSLTRGHVLNSYYESSVSEETFNQFLENLESHEIYEQKETITALQLVVDKLSEEQIHILLSLLQKSVSVHNFVMQHEYINLLECLSPRLTHPMIAMCLDLVLAMFDTPGFLNGGVREASLSVLLSFLPKLESEKIQELLEKIFNKINHENQSDRIDRIFILSFFQNFKPPKCEIKCKTILDVALNECSKEYWHTHAPASNLIISLSSELSLVHVRHCFNFFLNEMNSTFQYVRLNSKNVLKALAPLLKEFIIEEEVHKRILANENNLEILEVLAPAVPRTLLSKVFCIALHSFEVEDNYLQEAAFSLLLALIPRLEMEEKRALFVICEAKFCHSEISVRTASLLLIKSMISFLGEEERDSIFSMAIQEFSKKEESQVVALELIIHLFPYLDINNKSKAFNIFLSIFGLINNDPLIKSLCLNGLRAAIPFLNKIQRELMLQKIAEQFKDNQFSSFNECLKILSLLLNHVSEDKLQVVLRFLLEKLKNRQFRDMKGIHNFLSLLISQGRINKSHFAIMGYAEESLLAFFAEWTEQIYKVKG